MTLSTPSFCCQGLVPRCGSKVLLFLDFVRVLFSVLVARLVRFCCQFGNQVLFSVLVVRFVASSGNKVLFFSTLVFEISFLFISARPHQLSAAFQRHAFQARGHCCASLAKPLSAPMLLLLTKPPGSQCDPESKHVAAALAKCHPSSSKEVPRASKSLNNKWLSKVSGFSFLVGRSWNNK